MAGNSNSHWTRPYRGSPYSDHYRSTPTRTCVRSSSRRTLPTASASPEKRRFRLSRGPCHPRQTLAAKAAVTPTSVLTIALAMAWPTSFTRARNWRKADSAAGANRTVWRVTIPARFQYTGAQEVTINDKRRESRPRAVVSERARLGFQLRNLLRRAILRARRWWSAPFCPRARFRWSWCAECAWRFSRRCRHRAAGSPIIPKPCSNSCAASSKSKPFRRRWPPVRSRPLRRGALPHRQQSLSRVRLRGRAASIRACVVMHESNLHHLIADLTIRRDDWDAYLRECEYNGGADGAGIRAARARARSRTGLRRRAHDTPHAGIGARRDRAQPVHGRRNARRRDTPVPSPAFRTEPGCRRSTAAPSAIAWVSTSHAADRHLRIPEAVQTHCRIAARVPPAGTREAGAPG